jgi:hypothetical protein
MQVCHLHKKVCEECYRSGMSPTKIQEILMVSRESPLSDQINTGR